jgi:tetratricopeptide (TPR) repeat protein
MAATPPPTLDQQVGLGLGAQAESPCNLVDEARPSPAEGSVMEEQAARSLLAFAEDAGRGLRGLHACRWRDRLQSRFQDLEAAFDWLLDHGHTADALELASALADLLRTTGRVAIGRRWLDRALEAATIDDHLRAVALYENGLLAFWQGADEEACSLHGRSLELARRLGDRTTVALALCGLARVALREDLDWARTLCEEALGTVQDTNDTIGRSNALHVLGVAAQMRGDLRQARDLMVQRIELARELGDFATIGAESSNLSMVERQLGNLARAEQLAREALQIAEQRGDQWAIPYSLNGLAAVAVETGEFERAATLLAAAAGLQDQQGNAWPPDEAPHYERSRAAVGAALDHDQLERVWSAGQRMPSAHAVRYALAPRPNLRSQHRGGRVKAEVAY